MLELNKVIRQARHHAGTGIVMRPLGKSTRIVALTDASHNKNKIEPSIFGGFFYLSDLEVDYDQNLFTQDPDTAEMKAQARWVNGSLLYWRMRVVQRRVDDILDVETLSLAYGSVTSEYLNNMKKEMQLSDREIKPFIYNDNNSTVSHIRSSNKHKNPRLNVLWSVLREAYTNNQFAIGWLCGKTQNTGDLLTKRTSPMLNIFLQSSVSCM